MQLVLKFIQIVKKRGVFEVLEVGCLSKMLKFLEDFDVDNLDREIE